VLMDLELRIIWICIYWNN